MKSKKNYLTIKMQHQSELDQIGNNENWILVQFKQSQQLLNTK